MKLVNIYLILVTTYSALVFAAIVSGRSQKIACQGKTLKIDCITDLVIEVLRVNYGRLSPNICNVTKTHAELRNTICVSKKSLEIVQDACSFRRSCTLEATDTAFGNECSGTDKYLEVEYECVEIGTASETYRVACESTNLSINCGKGREVVILDANYGRLSSAVCNVDGRATIRDIECSTEKTAKIVREYCLEKEDCIVPATNEVFGDPCIGTYKYLEVNYICGLTVPKSNFQHVT